MHKPTDVTVFHRRPTRTAGELDAVMPGLAPRAADAMRTAIQDHPTVQAQPVFGAWTEIGGHVVVSDDFIATLAGDRAAAIPGFARPCVQESTADTDEQAHDPALHGWESRQGSYRKQLSTLLFFPVCESSHILDYCSSYRSHRQPSSHPDVWHYRPIIETPGTLVKPTEMALPARMVSQRVVWRAVRQHEPVVHGDPTPSIFASEAIDGARSKSGQRDR